MTGKKIDTTGFPFVRDNPRGLMLDLFVQPRAKQKMIAGIHGNALKIKLTAPPVDGAANKMCLDFLAKLFNIPKSAVSIISGQSGRTKRLFIHCETDQAKLSILQRLKKILQN